MQETTVIRALLVKDIYMKYSRIMFALKDLEREYKLILKTIRKYYYEFDNAEGMSVDELRSYFYAENPSVQNADAIKKIFSDLKLADLGNEALIIKILNQVVEKYYCSEIMEVAMGVAQEQSPHGISKIEGLIERYTRMVDGLENIESEVCSMSFDEIINKETNGNYYWPIKLLRDSMGPIHRGQLGHIFARPNVGKSSLAIHLAIKTANTIRVIGEDRPILYLNNEEIIERIKLRALSCTGQMSFEQLKEEGNRQFALEEWERIGCNKIKFIGDIGHIAAVEKHIRNFEPGMTIIDQGPKMRIYDRDMSEVARLQYLYNMYRQMAKKYDTAIITTGQASNTADNKDYVTLNMLDSSKVGIPGELDWAIGIGQKNDDSRFVRYINVAKNKGRMGRGSCTFIEDICRYFDLGDKNSNKYMKRGGPS